MPTLYMLIGVPGSGKSTWVDAQDIENVAVISTDNYIEEWARANNTTYSEIFPKVIGGATRTMNEFLRQSITLRKNLYWDQTNLTVKSRASKLRNIPMTYKKIAVVFKTPDMDTLNSRLKNRPGKVIPMNIVMGMISQMEIPTVDEGFDEVIYA